MKKNIINILLGCALTMLIISCSSKSSAEVSNIPASDNIVRLSLITVDSTQLNTYNTFLKEEIEASMLLEPGVLSLYAVSEKENPYKIIILEIYANETAYKSHLKTPHFIKYKEGTMDMVLKLELVDTNPLIPGLKIK